MNMYYMLEKIERLKAAIEEAKRFTEAAQIAVFQFESKAESAYHSVSFAAAKRSSMDLTRALANLRRRPE